MIQQEFVQQMNAWGKSKTPFLFILDFELEKPLLVCLDEINPEKIKFNFNGFTNARHETQPTHKQLILQKKPIDFSVYKRKFEIVSKHLHYGDSFLTNLTIKTPISVNETLASLFNKSSAPYKLVVEDDFLVFSPEIFVRIENGQIFSYPMKGTIDASIQEAEKVILTDEKEKAEHITIVDLIRNDLSLVADKVSVKRFRYIDRIKTHDKTLLQVSSEIVGELPHNYEQSLGTLLAALLPAGSISGAPKKRTVEIIAEAEQEKRGYYTGVMGYYNGSKLDSAVMIRYIEQVGEQFYYRSGGGITTQSVCEREYEEALAKVYVPVF